MLVVYQDEFKAYIEIAVASWKCEENSRTMILIPRMIRNDSYCEIEIVCHENSTLVIVSDAINRLGCSTREWFW